MASESDKHHIVLFPFMAQGHINPFLDLALHLDHRPNYVVSLVSTPLNVAKLRRTIPPSSSLRLLQIPFVSSDHGLPPHTENTDSLPYHLILRFLTSSLLLKPAVTDLIADLCSGGGLKPVCIISDMFFSWCADIAHRFGIYHAVFIAGGGYGFACYRSLWLNLPHRDGDAVLEEFSLPDFPEASKLHVTQLTGFLRDADGTDSFSSFLQSIISDWGKSDAALLNTVEEFDSVGLNYFRRNLLKPVWAIGPVLLLSPKPGKKDDAAASASSEICRIWLDSKPPNSVLYVSFGSQNTISRSQMTELATGLETSGVNFIWVVRPPLGFDINSEFRSEEWLPEGFEGRIGRSGRGLLVRKWAAQVEILSHGSVGGFVSHCGWNSVMESLSNGVPILGWPLASEQFYNAKVLEEEIGVCVEVGRGQSCVVESGDLKDRIVMVMGGSEKGVEIRRRGGEIREMIKEAIRDEKGRRGSSVEAMDEFLTAALEYSGRKFEGVTDLAP